ncbi:MAG: hypothetical protein GY707_15170 [Desulfobacteraceae bacterium]|nr:hypothetical protein [Desulfobacteraceae bacterium]
MAKLGRWPQTIANFKPVCTKNFCKRYKDALQKVLQTSITQGIAKQKYPSVSPKEYLFRTKDRDPVKRRRDRHQGVAAVMIVLNYLTQYKFKQSELRMFPADVIEKARRSIDNMEILPDFN